MQNSCVLFGKMNSRDLNYFLNFDDLFYSILSLFEKSHGDTYHCVYLLGGTVAMKDVHEGIITSFIGDIGEFYDWLKPKLEIFYNDFQEHFHTDDERKNRRRRFVYESIVKLKACKRDTFKRNMMKDLMLDILAFDVVDGAYVGEYTDTIANRRMLFYNCIENYINRLFLINIECFP